MKFHIARLSFVPSVQKALVEPKFEGTPIELARKIFSIRSAYRILMFTCSGTGMNK